MIATPVFPDLAALVADESLYMRRILRDMLTRVGIKRVFEAPDGAEALGVLSEFEARPRHHRLGPRDPLGRGVHPPHPDAEDLAGPDGADHPDAVEAAALRRRPGGGARRQRGHRQAVLAEDPVVAPRRGAQPPARLRRGERALAPGAPRAGRRPRRRRPDAKLCLYGLGSGAEPLHSSSQLAPRPLAALAPRDSTVSVKDEVVAQPDLPGHVAATSPHGDLPSAPPVRHNGRPPWPHAHHRRAAPQNGYSYAALDLGTNNCRLLVAEPAPYGFRVIDAFSRIVRLGEGLGIGEPPGRGGDRAHHRGAARLQGQDGSTATRRGRASSRPRRAGSPRTAPRSSPASSPSSTWSSRSSTGAPRPISPSPAARRSPIRDAHSVVIFDIGGGSTEIAWLDGKARKPARRPDASASGPGTRCRSAW